jgi:hypothetical protein
VREILYRPLYRGLIVWGELQKYENKGTKKRRPREEKDWVRIDAPDLRIITPDLWAIVEARLARAKAKSRSAFRDQESKYLLTGMARCAHCGGPMQIVGQDYHRRKGRFYGCAFYKNRGSSICKNSLLGEQEVLDQIVLKSIQEALTEDMIKVTVDKALEKHRAGRGTQLDRRTAIERELSLIEAKQVHLVDAIAAGDKNRMLLDRLKVEETRREELIRELEEIKTATTNCTIDEARFKREVKARVADMRGLLGRHVSCARQLLKALLEQPLRFEKVEDGGRRCYRILGTGSYLPLLENSGYSLLPGIWCPQRDFLKGEPTP